jgi:hypothetical protein
VSFLRSESALNALPMNLNSLVATLFSNKDTVFFKSAKETRLVLQIFSNTNLQVQVLQFLGELVVELLMSLLQANCFLTSQHLWSLLVEHCSFLPNITINSLPNVPNLNIYK